MTIFSGHGCERAKPDLRQQQHDHQRHAAAVRPQERQRPGQQRIASARRSAGLAHPRRPSVASARAAAVGVARTRFGAIFGMFRATTRSLLESADVEPGAPRAARTRRGSARRTRRRPPS